MLFLRPEVKSSPDPEPWRCGKVWMAHNWAWSLLIRNMPPPEQTSKREVPEGTWIYFSGMECNVPIAMGKPMDKACVFPLEDDRKERGLNIYSWLHPYLYLLAADIDLLRWLLRYRGCWRTQKLVRRMLYKPMNRFLSFSFGAYHHTLWVEAVVQTTTAKDSSPSFSQGWSYIPFSMGNILAHLLQLNNLKNDATGWEI